MTDLARMTYLIRSLELTGETRLAFDFTRGPASFSVVVLAGRRPCKMLFGLRGGQFAFAIEIRWDPKRQCFWALDRFDAETYKGLCVALQLTYDPSNPFTPKSFFTDLDSAAPSSLAECRVPEPHEYPRSHELDLLEHPERRYFERWLPHTPGMKKPSPSNLNKTREYFGDRFYLDCKEHLISSCWTDDPARKQQVTPPSR